MDLRQPIEVFKTLESEIKNDSQIPLSDSMIERLTNGLVKVIRYTDLDEYKTIENVVGEHGIVIHLSVQDYNSGHYISMWKRDNVVYIYDSYGLTIAQDVQRSSYIINETNERDNLFILLDRWKSQGGYVSVNNFAHQDINKPQLATCGFHALFRLNRKYLDHIEYNKFLKYKGLNPDEIVTLALCNFIT